MQLSQLRHSVANNNLYKSKNYTHFYSSSPRLEEVKVWNVWLDNLGQSNGVQHSQISHFGPMVPVRFALIRTAHRWVALVYFNGKQTYYLILQFRNSYHHVVRAILRIVIRPPRSSWNSHLTIDYWNSHLTLDLCYNSSTININHEFDR